MDSFYVNQFGAYVTLASFIVFIGICAWALSKRQTEAFKQAAMLPFADDDAPAEESQHE
jgi:cytochrome c oxidase cbb3-type subunit 4